MEAQVDYLKRISYTSLQRSRTNFKLIIPYEPYHMINIWDGRIVPTPTDKLTVV